MAWLLLIVAGLCEIAWPVGLKLAQQESLRVLGIGLVAFGLLTSIVLLFWVQREIPMGTAYAVWTGIGAAGTFVVGVMFFGESADGLRWLSVALILAGVIGLKLSHS